MMVTAVPLVRPLVPSSAGPIASEILELGCELLPLPAAHILRHAGGFEFEAVNQAFRLAGFGANPARSPMLRALGDRIDQFLASDDKRLDVDWQFGPDVDCRHYRVTLARTSVQVRNRCAVSFVDRTPQIMTERTLRREMTTDSLTGLPNREGFAERIEMAVANGERVAVLALDLMRFGRFNACLGTLAGDELLITVARRVKGALRARDTLARIGGDEFAILIAIDQDEGEADYLARRLAEAFATPFRLSEYKLNVECTIGIALSDTNEIEPEKLIRHAQFAGKRAKESGRPEWYQNQAFTVARELFVMETALRHAVENNELSLHYQPICDITTGQITSFEALARWTDGDGRELPPSHFIPVAEEAGLIVPLGRWAIEEAARTLAAWDARAGGDCGARLAVNLSAIQLQRDSVPELVARTAAKHGLSPDRFTLELTESAIVSDPDRCAGVMRALKDLGTTLAMDDFGTGYSNLAYLQRLPIDILKIDRSFVTGMHADRDKIAIVRAILSLSQALGMKTTAEGIESHELAQTLAALGCTYGQGYLYSRAIDGDAAYQLLTAGPLPVPTSSSAI